MDSFEWNKIFGAVLGTVLFIAAVNIGVGKWMAPHKSDKPGIEVDVVETPANGGPAAVEVAPDWGTVLPVADAAAGEAVARKCLTCHDFTKGGPNKAGPNLYGVLGAKHARQASFTAYSRSIRDLAAQDWTYDAFNKFIKEPRKAIPGTNMNFPGVSKVQDRVNLIAFLRTRSDAAPAIPAPNPAAPPPAAPADGAAEPPAGELQAPPPGTAPGAAPAAPPAH